MSAQGTDTTRVREPAIEMDFLLRHINSVIRSRGKIALQDYGITLVQFQAMLILRDGPITMGGLCEKLGIASSTVTELVDRMERNGLVERIRSHEDRRVVKIALLERGREVLEDVLRRREAFLASVLRRLPEEDVSCLVTLLGKLWKVMSCNEEGPQQDTGGATCGNDPGNPTTGKTE